MTLRLWVTNLVALCLVCVSASCVTPIVSGVDAEARDASVASEDALSMPPAPARPLGYILPPGPLTTGNVVQASGGTVVMGAVNVAGGANYVTGKLPVANGGTGVSTINAHSVVVGEGTSPITALLGAANLPLLGGGASADPSFGFLPPGSISSGGASSSQVLEWNGIAWAPASLPSGGITQLTGDVVAGPGSGSVAATVARVNGATIPAAGALTTGNGPYVSGSSALSYSALNLAGGAGWVSGQLPVANGGTGDATLTSHAVLLGAGTSAVTSVGPGTTNLPLLGAGGSADPTFAAMPVGSLAQSGATSNQVVQWNGSAWAPATISTGGFPAPTSEPAGSTVTMSRAASQSYWFDSTGAVNTANLPSTPTSGDVVILKNVGASVAVPLSIVASGGYTCEIPGNAGNFTAANGTTSWSSQGGTLWLQADATNTRWGIIASWQ